MTIMNLSIYILIIFACIVFLGMVVYLLLLKKKAGTSLFKLWCIGTFSVFSISAFLLLFAIFVFLEKTTISTNIYVYTFIFFIISIYCLIHGFIQRNSISENGIIVFLPFPHFVEWHHIENLKLSKYQLFLKINNSYESIDILNRDKDIISQLITEKIKQDVYIKV